MVAPLRILRRGEGDKHEGNVRVQSLGSGTALAICRLCNFLFHNNTHLLNVHVEVVEAVLVDVVAGEGPHVLPLDPELLSRDVQPQEHVHGRHAWI